MPSHPQTLVDCLLQRVREESDKPAVFTFVGRKQVIRNWGQIGKDVLHGVAVLQQYGIRPGERVAQLSENRYEWLVADLAIQSSGAMHVPIHAPLPAAAVMQQVRDSGSKVLIVSNDSQWQKIAGEVTGDGLTVLCHDACPARPAVDDQAMTPQPMWKFPHEHTLSDAWEQLPEIRSDDPATLMYTSGTTGTPRGVLLSHRNLYSNTAAVLEAFLPRTHDRRLNFLPLSHIFARTCDWYVTIVSGTELGLATSRESIFDDCQQFRPTVLNGVPYFFDKVRRTLLEQSSNPSTKSLQEILGGQITLCNVGGAALPDHLFDFFHQRSVPLRQGYGLTESSPVITLSTEDRFRPGSVGTAIPDVEIRIADDGEILTRGPHVMLGYWNDPAATNATIRDGWLHTGDLGELDADGFLYVTGRRKELIVLASGKKVNPTRIESLLTADPLILQAFVVGEGRNYLTALIVPNPDLLRKLIKKHWLLVFSQKQALNHRRVRQWYEEAIQRALADVAPWEQVKKFTLLGRGFTMDTGEMTPKLSLRRDVIERNCQREIEGLYG